MMIIDKSEEHNELVRIDLINEFGSEHIVSILREYKEASKLNGFLAKDQGSYRGILLYYIANLACELVYLHSFEPEKGIGKSLVQRLIDMAKSQRLKRIWVITTNDNLQALGFYQKVGFHMVKVYPDAMRKVKTIKPQIQEIGKNNIPLRDMIELEIDL